MSVSYHGSEPDIFILNTRPHYFQAWLNEELIELARKIHSIPDLLSELAPDLSSNLHSEYPFWTELPPMPNAHTTLHIGTDAVQINDFLLRSGCWYITTMDGILLTSVDYNVGDSLFGCHSTSISELHHAIYVSVLALDDTRIKVRLELRTPYALVDYRLLIKNIIRDFSPASHVQVSEGKIIMTKFIDRRFAGGRNRDLRPGEVVDNLLSTSAITGQADKEPKPAKGGGPGGRAHRSREEQHDIAQKWLVVKMQGGTSQEEFVQQYPGLSIYNLQRYVNSLNKGEYRDLEAQAS